MDWARQGFGPVNVRPSLQGLTSERSKTTGTLKLVDDLFHMYQIIVEFGGISLLTMRLVVRVVYFILSKDKILL